MYQAIQGCTGCTGPYRTAWGHMGLHWVYWAIQGCTRQYQAGAGAMWGQLPPQPWCHPTEGAAGCWVPPPKPPGVGGLVTPCAALQSPPRAPSRGRTHPKCHSGAEQPPCSPRSQQRVRRHCPIAAVGPPHRVTLRVWGLQWAPPHPSTLRRGHTQPCTPRGTHKPSLPTLRCVLDGSPNKNTGSISNLPPKTLFRSRQWCLGSPKGLRALP